MRFAYRLTALSSVLLLLGAVATFVTLVLPSADSPSHPSASASLAAASTDDVIATLQSELRKEPGSPSLLSELGSADLQKTRETGDPSYYTVAQNAFQQALHTDPNNAEAIRGMGSLALARHDFQQALTWAHQAVQLDPASSGSYGVLGDALVELGHYAEAIDAFQKMADIRPNLSAYSRISYVRELNGDVTGAIDAMHSAVEAGGPKGENEAWVRLQVGNLFFNEGDLDGAEAQYQSALEAFPDYVHALAGLAKVKAARGDNEGAVTLYNQVVQRYPVPEYVIALGDNYRALGDEIEAKRQYDLVSVIDKLYRANGVDSDLELANFYADHDIRLDEALRQAQAVYQRRPSIQAADGLAWALYKSGQYQDALKYSQEARRLGTQDARMLFHAGMIADALGNKQQAAAYLQKALDLNPHFSVLQEPQAREALTQIKAGGSSLAQATN